MRRFLAAVFCLTFTVSVYGSLPGQVDDEASGGVIYKKETRIDIDDPMDIDGTPDKPELEPITGRSPLEKDSLIKIRTSFERELLRSVHSL